jgi:hypothetical protein
MSTQTQLVASLAGHTPMATAGVQDDQEIDDPLGKEIVAMKQLIFDTPAPNTRPVSERDKALGWVTLFGQLPMPAAPKKGDSLITALDVLLDEWRFEEKAKRTSP